MKSLLYSVFVAPRKRYDAGAFNETYFAEDRVEDERAAYLARFFHPTTALDVGCGTGSLVRALRKAGVEAVGTEISRAALDRSRDDIRPHLSEGDILDIGYADERFDLVTCMDVLEHLPPEHADRAIRELVRVTGRRLLIHVCLWTERNARKDPTHINLRSRRYWRRKLAREGGRLVEVPADFPSGYNAFILEKPGRPAPR